MRLLNILVICTLVLAAAAVYKIKFDSTLQSARVGKLSTELRRERDAIAVLKAEWAKLDTPERIQGLADRHLALQPIKPTQFTDFDRLPPRPPSLPPAEPLVGAQGGPAAPATTGSVPPPLQRR